MIIDTEELLTPQNAAHRIGLSPSSLNNQLRLGVVPSVFIDGVRFVKASDADNYKARTRPNGGEPRPGRPPVRHVTQ